MSNDNQKYVIFDLDGTLIDSFECVLRCVNKALDFFSLPHVDIPPSERNGDIAVIFDKAKNRIGRVINFSDFKMLFDEIHINDCIDTVKPIDSNAELLKYYSSNRISIIIITNKKEGIAEKCMSHFFSEIKYSIIGRTTIEDIKRNVELIKKRLSNLDCKICNIIAYYGDSKDDNILSSELNVKYYQV